jgi:hypothetical protein
VDDPTTDPRWGRVGKQTIADGGPLPPHPNMDANAKFNMEDIDDELVRRSVDFIDRSVKADKPFFLWHNTSAPMCGPTSGRSGRTRADMASMQMPSWNWTRPSAPS